MTDQPRQHEAPAMADNNRPSLAADSQIRPAADGGVRVLVVEDNAVNQKVILRQLAKLGYTGEAVPDGSEALRALETALYDIVLMDCQMPVLDGFETTSAIRLRSGEAAHIPIVAMTANALKGDRERCIAAGMDDYISKPVDMRLLASVLEKWTRGRRPPQLLCPAGSNETLPVPTDLTPDENAGQVAWPLAVADDVPVLDMRVVADLRSLDEAGMGDVLSEMAALFQDDAPERLAAIETALQSGEGAALARAAHALKSSSGSMGAKRVWALCKVLEERGNEGAVAGGEGALPLLAAELERAYAALAELRVP